MTPADSISRLPSRSLDFLEGGGEMGARCRAFDWASTSLGPAENWPQSLRSAVGILLPSRAQIILFWGPERVCIYNDAYTPIFGSRHPWALGRAGADAWSVIWHVLGPLLDGVVRTGEAFSAQDFAYFVDRGGFLEEVYFDVSYDPVRDETGGVGGVFCIVSETTPRVLGERRLRTMRDLGAQAAMVRESIGAAAQAAIETLAKNPRDLPFAMLFLPEGDNFLLGAVTPGPEDLLRAAGLLHPGSWPIEEVFNTRTTRIVSGISLPQLQLEGLPEGRTPTEAVVLPLSANELGRAQGVLVVGVSAVLALDDSYKSFFGLLASHVATAIANATAYQEEKKRAEALAELDRAKTAFFSNVSHEFRTPLTLMLGPLEEMLAMGDTLHPSVTELAAVTHRNGLRLQRLVNTLLDFSRIEAGRMKASYESTDLAVFTAELASNFRSAMEKAGLRYRVDCPPLSRPVYVDREMWEKIVLNLLSNALKFTFEGEISVRLEEQDDAVVFSVEDTGIGIPASELPQIFDRFKRVEGARGRTQEGTGIGLALVAELAKLHAGKVEASSQLDKGSKFSVSIPFGVAHLPSDHVDAAPALSSTAIRTDSYVDEAVRWISGSLQSVGPRTQTPERIPSGGRILLADDNADMREYVRRLLDGMYEVEAVTNGEEARASVLDHPPDLVLSDIMMPGLDGFGLLQEIRENSETRDIPVILLSARAGEEAKVEGLEAGASDYLTKPFTAKELLARVGTHLALARERREAFQREAELLSEAEKARDEAVGVLESMTDGFLALDRNWCFTYVNGKSERLLGMGREQLIGKSLWELFPASLGTIVHREYLRAAADRVPVEFDNFYAPWNRWFHIKAYPTSEDGLSVFYEDVTEQKRTQDQLREGEERLRAAGRAASVGTWRIDLSTGLDTRDASLNDLLGLEANDTTQPIADFINHVHPEDRTIVEAALRKAVQERSNYHAECRIVRPDGTVRWLLNQGRVLCNENGEPRFITGAAVDVTQRRNAEDALRRANEDLEQFAYSASHDLQEPIRNVALYSELLDRRYSQLLDSAGVAYVKGVREGAGRMNRLVSDLLAYTRTTSVIDEAPALVHAGDALQKALTNLSGAIAESGAEVVSGDLPDLRIHEVHLQQLFQNLIGNSIKYRGDAPPRIRVAAECIHGLWRFSVEDNGIGIEPKYQQQIFGMFKRLHTGAQYSGTGIGLAICQRLVERYGGRIWVESAPGEGSTFYFTLRSAGD